jgi:hypothetical protein
MSMMDDALPMHTAGLLAGFGKAATYRRGTTNLSVNVVAQGGKQDSEYATKLGSSPDATDYVVFTPELGYCGFSVQVVDLASLTPPTPIRGDVLIIGADSYPMMAIENANPWRWEDLPYKTWFRLHTKLS